MFYFKTWIYIYIKLCIMRDNNANQTLQLTKHMTLSPFRFFFFQELAFKHVLRNEVQCATHSKVGYNGICVKQ